MFDILVLYYIYLIKQLTTGILFSTLQSFVLRKVVLTKQLTLDNLLLASVMFFLKTLFIGVALIYVN